jgi:hypothetical protein
MLLKTGSHGERILASRGFLSELTSLYPLTVVRGGYYIVQSGIHFHYLVMLAGLARLWIPAFAGMTGERPRWQACVAPGKIAAKK